MEWYGDIRDRYPPEALIAAFGLGCIVAALWTTLLLAVAGGALAYVSYSHYKVRIALGQAQRD